MTEQTKNISTTLIDDPKSPMRTSIDRDGIWNLAESIKREGLINPITIRPKGERFEVVAGHRRFMACKVAGMVEVSCIVRELTDEQADEIMAHENLERQDVDLIEEALLIGRLVGENENNIPEVANRMNRSRAWVESRLEILTYPDFMVAALKSGQLKLGVAHWIGMIEDDFWRKNYTDQATSSGMSVVQANYVYELWKMGGSPPAAEVLAQAVDGAPYTPPKPSATCAACAKTAISPNLRMVWVHVECPSESESS
jgi:ParB/RepB/Spo0J family partition protein